MTTTRKPRTTTQVLNSIADDGRFSRAEVEELREEIASWAEKADELRENLTSIYDMDLDIDTEPLEVFSTPVDPADPNGPRENPFVVITEAIETIRAAHEKAEEIDSSLSDFASTWGSFEDHSETWLDEDQDKDDRAYAREEMVGWAGELRDKIKDLEYLFGIKFEEFI
ncbi:hypothetical protein [Nocardia sp. NPDC057440]|uniref:hypothetical protein n=1 Tax=Nocardia sp. NPDC057440 TaxID=3346134 RepID=UPI00366D32DE